MRRRISAARRHAGSGPMRGVVASGVGSGLKDTTRDPMNLGCPGIAWTDESYEGRLKVSIDPFQCTGCTVCAQVCPTDAIKPLSRESLQ